MDRRALTDLFLAIGVFVLAIGQIYTTITLQRLIRLLAAHPALSGGQDGGKTGGKGRKANGVFY